MKKLVTTTTENIPAEQRTQMQEMREKRKEVAKRQYEYYTA